MIRVNYRMRLMGSFSKTAAETPTTIFKLRHSKL